ncbi:MAG TPA: outer membrane lipoprotein carrier protein LolA [Verrucomicrobiae bacterium]|nr:outer membrane lipoprotein carrier protein LolA [Verrucomicrobiae bacterium]
MTNLHRRPGGMRRVLARCLPVLALAALLLPGSAAAAGGAAALERLRASLAATEDFTAEIVQEKHLSILKKKLVSHGTVKFRKPDLFLMELAPPEASRLLLRDSLLEIRMPDGARQQIPLPGDQGLRKWVSLLARPVTSLPEGVEASSETGAGGETVTIRPGKGQVASIAVTLAADGKIRSLQIAEKNGNRTLVTFRKMRTNVGLSEKEFRIEP